MISRVRARQKYTPLATIEEKPEEEARAAASVPPPPPPPVRRAVVIGVVPAPLQARPPVRVSRGLLPETRDKAKRNEDQAQEQSLRHASSNRAPGVGGEELGSLGGGDVSTYRWHYEASVASRGGGDGTTLQGDRFSLSVSQPLFHNGDATYLAGATAARDSLSFSLSDLIPGGGSRGAVFTLRPNYVSFGGAGALHFANGDTVGGSLAARVQCASSLRLLKCQGDSAQLEQKVQHTVGPQLTGGVGVGAVGIGARFTAVSRREVLYRSWRPLPEASALLVQDSKHESWRDSIWNWLRHKVQGAGLQATPLQLPDLTRLDAAGLRVGDEIVMTVTPKTGFVTGGLALALGGVLAGGYYAFHREVLLAVRREENDVIDVAVTRRLTHSVTLGLDVPILADAHHTRVAVHAVADLFRFDLAEAPATFAYLRLWQQQALPEGAAKHPERLDNLADIAAVLRQEHFDPGISRLGFELLTIPGKTVRAAGASSPWYLPPLRQPGWNFETHGGVEKYLEFTPRSSLLTRRLELERRSERPTHREHRAAAYAIQSKYLPALPAPQNVEEALVLGARFGYERFSGKQRTHLVNALNKKILTEDIAHYIDPQGASEVEAVVERIYGPDDLEALASVPLDDALIAATRIPMEEVQQLQNELAAVTSWQERSDAVCNFVERVGVHSSTGGEAVGLIHRLLSPKRGGDRSLRILLNYRAAGEATRRASELKVMYGAAAAKLNTAAHLGQRVADVTETLGTVRQLLHDINLDPIMQTYDTPGWLKLADHLREVRAGLWELLRSAPSAVPLPAAATQAQSRVLCEKAEDAATEAQELERRIAMLYVQTDKVDEASIGRWVANVCQASREVSAWRAELLRDGTTPSDPTYRLLQQQRRHLQDVLRRARCHECSDARLLTRLREAVQASLQIL